MTGEAALKAFYGIFRGNELFFVKHQKPFTEKEGKLKARWCGFAVYNRHTPPPEDKAQGDLIPVTLDHYREHLNGNDGLAISPLTNVEDSGGNIVKRNVCYFAAIDIDVYGVNFTTLVQRLYKYGFQFMAALSKSGGLHLYFFFREAEPADKVIAALSKIVEVFGLNRLYVSDKQKSKVEIFPKQASFIPGDRNANCLFLPFYNSAGASPNKMLAPDGNLFGIIKALPVIESNFTTVKDINEIIAKLPYSDAPFCVQMLALTGALTEGAGRSNYLFAAGVYLKKKCGDNFYDLLAEMNECCESPLEQEDVEFTYKSVTDKEKNWDGYGCKKSPCADYCDKKLCKQREYGVGRGKGGRDTGADCWGQLVKYNTGEGKEPYYTWEVCVEEGGEFKTVQIDSHKDLLNQMVVQQCCLRDLDWIPTTVKRDSWEAIVRRCLENVKKVQVPLAADTTETAMIRDSFYKFLTHAQVRRGGQPYAVKTGQVYHANGAYYFDTKGLLDFLKANRHVIGKFNIGKWLADEQGCAQEAELVYTTPRGEQKSIRCWKKDETPELLEMGSFYDDVYEGDADYINNNPLKKEETGGDDDTKF